MLHPYLFALLSHAFNLSFILFLVSRFFNVLSFLHLSLTCLLFFTIFLRLYHIFIHFTFLAWALIFFLQLVFLTCIFYLVPFYPSLMCRHSFSSFIFPSRWPPSPLFIANNILGSLLTLFTFTRFSLYYLHSVSCIHLPILTLLPPSCLLYLLLLPLRSFFLRSLFSHALTEPILSSFSSVSRPSISLSRYPLLVSLRSTETE